MVIGAGPAGSLTARRLAERGYDVVLLEEHAEIGRPSHCTGLLGLEAFDEFDLPRQLILGEAQSARFWGVTGPAISVASDRVHAAVIDRVRLDIHLAERATAAGVDVRLNWRVQSIDVGMRGVRVRSAAGQEVEARAGVLACGANYRFHRPLGLGLPAAFLQSAQLEVPFPALPATQVEVRFGRQVAPGGFAWLVSFLRAGVSHARIGLMAESSARGRFESFLGSLCHRTGAVRALLPTPRLKVLPLAPVERTYRDRLVAVGDAAGLVKPTTGGGIYYGLLSGAMASDVLAGALREDRLGAGVLRGYERQWRRRLGSEIRAGLAFRRVAAQLTDQSIDALMDVARVNGIVPLLQKNASFNWHRKAAMALLAHPSFRTVALKSFARSGGLL